MKVALIGYGKMGQIIEQILTDSGNEVVLKINIDNVEEFTLENLKKADVAIEFTSPHSAVGNIKKCLDAGVPVVVGSTGWYGELEDVKKHVEVRSGALLYAPNFSIGVNLFFDMARKMAKSMNTHPLYKPNVIEIHHLQKLDAPSGTAIKAVEIMLEELNQFDGWVLNEETTESKIGIEAQRLPNVPGTHKIIFKSGVDQIELSHEAFSRKGFAEGAVEAAKFLLNRKGIFTMTDVLMLK